METALIRVKSSGLYTLFSMDLDGRSYEEKCVSEALVKLSSPLTHRFMSVADRNRVIRRASSALVPWPIVSAAKEWLARRTDDGVIAVQASSEVSGLPWETILAGVDLAPPDCVVVHALEHGNPPPRIAPRALAVVWRRLGELSFSGAERELTELARRFSTPAFQVRTVADPTRIGLHKAVETELPELLHLSLPSMKVRETESPQLPVTGEKTDIEWISLDAFEGLLKVAGTGNPGVKILILNGGCTGYPATERLCRSLDAIVVGWDGLVPRTVTCDFALFLYQRLSEGHTIAEAVHAFARTLLATRNGPDLWRDCLPVLYYPGPAWVDWRPITPAPQRESNAPQTLQGGPKLEAMGSRGFVPEITRGSAAVNAPPTPPAPEVPWIRVDFSPREPINPALLVNGKPPIASISIDSPRRQTVRLKIECDTGAAVSTYRQTLDLDVGLHPSSMADAVFFPVLHELVERKARRRRIVMTLTVESLDGARCVEVTKSATWMGADEWIDRPETWQWVPAFIDPVDSVIAEIIQTAVPVLRTIGDPTHDFTGYQGNSAEHTDRQVQALFQTLRDGNIRYVPPAGGAIADPGRGRSLGQLVRRHREVLQHRLGTCHDLALLLAACAEHINIHPIVVLVPGHTFFGFWRTREAHSKFWTALGAPTGAPTWTIEDGSKLKSLVDAKDVVLVEATDICRAFSYAAACSAGTARLDEAIAHELVGFDVAIDVRKARDGGVQPV